MPFKDPKKRNAYEKKNKDRIKKQVFSVYSKRLSNSKVPCCACCNKYKQKKFLIFLTIDHIKPLKPRATKRKRKLIGLGLWRYLRRNRYPRGYQVLCMNCNAAKSDLKTCPHQVN